MDDKHPEHSRGISLVFLIQRAKNCTGAINLFSPLHVPTDAKNPFFTRRKFLAGGLVAGGMGLWLSMSSSWYARFFRERLREVGRTIPPARYKPEPARWSDSKLTFAWLGHATVLVNFHGVRILVDPTLFSRIGVHLGLGTLGPKRLTAPALRASEIPEVDLVLVTHAHFDHLDTPSLSAVRGRPAAIMSKGTSDLMPRRPYSSVRELGWGETVTVETPRGGVTVRSIEVKHWGARVRRDTWRGYGGFVIERDGRKLLFAGDTADTPLLAGHRHLGPFEAAFMPVGAYDPWIHNHCTPEQAVAMTRAAGAGYFVPIHHQTFKLSNEPFLDPIERVQAALAREPDRLAVRDIGQTVVI
jgi:L-ascorbate metabolism protein UlaG (beta-lactamase superfamily)